MKTIGIIGLGSIGMRHAKNLIEMGHHVIGHDPDKEKSRQLATAGGIEWDGSIEEQELDGIVIASPSERHYHDIIECITDLVPFLVEKPIATAPMPENMKEPLKHYFSRLPHMVGYNLRFHSCVKKAKEWLPRIGDIQWANFTLGQYSEKPPYLRDGVILNWSHEIDLALYLLGPAKVMNSTTRIAEGADDITDIMLWHQRDISSHVHLDYVTNPDVRSFFIAGTLGNISADLKRRQVHFEGSKERPEHYSGFDSWNDNYIEEMQAFIDRVDGKETLGCTAEEALRVLDICLEVRKQAGLT